MYITIFTPTYNRSKYLSKLYESLKKQKTKNFEWLIIDDDSSDSTLDIVNEFKNQKNEFEIRYYKQEHGGKHRAINKGVCLAKGDFFFIVDSDDFLTNDALILLNKWLDDIKDNNQIAGVSGLRISSSGKLLGGHPRLNSEKYIDATNFERDKYNLGGDKAEVYKTSILKEHPFPTFEGEYFVTEDVVWSIIAYEGYMIRWYNKPIYICDYLDEGLTKTGSNEIPGHIKNYNGFIYYIRQSQKIKPTSQFILNFSDYERTARYLRKSFLERAKELEISPYRYWRYKLIERPFFLGIKKINTLFQKGRG